jgi:hypothetical protein
MSVTVRLDAENKDRLTRSLFLTTIVLCARLAVLVPPRQRHRSIVEDCTEHNHNMSDSVLGRQEAPVTKRLTYSLTPELVFDVTSVNVPFRDAFDEGLGMRRGMRNRVFDSRLEIVDGRLQDERSRPRA